jgi:superfamily II DNA or RNA helicase
MKLSFVPKEPDKAYVANALWLPKRGLRIDPFKKSLEFIVKGQGGQITNLAMWEESTNHLICPREFLQTSAYKNFKFPFVDLRPQFQQVRFNDLVVPRNEEQESAWKAFSANNNGILNLGCGKGKTKLALKKIAQRGMPTLVIVPDGGILSQWQESIYGNKKKNLAPGLEFDGELGLIQGPVFNWAKPITLALVTTIALRIRDGAVPEELYRYFGQVIYDEVHQIGAPMFSLTASPFYGDRIGLTATVQREDGLDPIYRYHIGEPFYKDIKQDLKPRIYFQQSPCDIKYADAKINGMINISVLRSMLGRNLQSNVFRYWSIRMALDEGRKVLCLSHSKDQLRLFHKMFPGSGLIISETEKSERMDVLRDSQICFAIAKLGSTGIDDDRLDTLFWLTPFRSRIALQQSMGRIQRFLLGKKTPVMTVFEDWMAPPLRQLCRNLKGSLKEWGYDYDTIKPLKLETTLPPEVQAAYDKAFGELPERGEVVEGD